MKQAIFSIITCGLLLAGLQLSGQQPAGKAPKIPTPTGDVRKAAPQAGEAPKIQIGKAETITLSNGLKVIVVENHKLPRVSYQIFVDTDPLVEGDAAGYVQMMGDLLGKGTKTRTKPQIDEAIDFIGANMFTSANGVNGSCLTKHSDKLLEIMSDVLLNPAFPEDELTKSKKRTESGLQTEKDNADAIAGNVGNVLRYGKGHPYGENMTEETLQKIDLDKIKKHYGTYFKPNTSYFVCVGDITKAQAEKYAQKYFGNWAKGDVPQHTYAVPQAPAQSQVDFVHKPGAVQSVINITYPVDLKPGTPDAIPSSVMNTLLGGYFNSRVNANLREGKGYTYGARTGLSADELVGNFNATASVRNAVTDSSIIEFMKELNRLRTEKVAADELQVVKNVLTGNFSASLEQPGTVARFALNTARYNLPADYYEKYLERLQSVTADEVQAMAQKYIKPDNAHILVVGNKEDVADRLKPFAKSGKVNFYDIYGKPLDDIKVAVPAGLTAQQVVDDYVNAIGGAAAIQKWKDADAKATVSLGPGMDMIIRTVQKDNAKVATEVSMNGQTMSKQVYDGAKGYAVGPGGAQEVTGSELDDLKEQAAFCKEAGYKSKGYTLTLKGVENVEGKNAYVVQVKRPDNKETTEYYDMATSLKIREISTQGAGDQSATIITDFSDYKPVNGVQFPHTLTISGAMPIPLKAQITEIKVNQGVDDSVFKAN